MSIKLRDLIKQVRSCKTAAEERAVVSKECANIRTVLKDKGNDKVRAKNVSKLMYIHMLGYPTDFGQMECVKLISSSSFAEKRVGYLALMLLLDEHHEVLTLIESRLDKDLQDENQFIQGLALATLANISSEDIARDLANQASNLMLDPNPYVRKKAALCGLRIVRKLATTDIVEQFVGKLHQQILNDKNHGALVAKLTLVVEGLQMPQGEPHLEAYRKLVPQIVKMLKNLVMSSYANEHDVSGVADPFLQVRLLQLLRLTGQGDRPSTEVMNDTLAQVATNTESTRNAGNAILYECVNTIINIEADPGLRTLAINILGRFLINKDNNLRYVALNKLTAVVAQDRPAVQRHKNTIVDCLKDADVSIRKRALDLIYALVNQNNIRLLVPDLITYLSFAHVSLKPGLTEKICYVVDRYSPNPQWHIDTMIKVLTIAGGYVPEAVGSRLCGLISQSSESLQIYSVSRFWVAVQTVQIEAVTANEGLTNSSSIAPSPTTAACQSVMGVGSHILSELTVGLFDRKDTLLQVAVYCFGEWCNLLTSASEVSELLPMRPTIAQVLEMINMILCHPSTAPSVKPYCLTAIVKCATRCASSSDAALASQYLHDQTSSCDVEVQQRAFEYCVLLQNFADDSTSAFVRGALAPMPPIPNQAGLSSGFTSVDDPSSRITNTASPVMSSATPVATAAAPAPPVSDGLDLLDSMFMPPAASTASDDLFSPVQQQAMSPTVTATTASNAIDDLFAPIASSAPPAVSPASPSNAVDDLFGGPSLMAPQTQYSAPTPAQNQISHLVAYEKPNELVINFTMKQQAATGSNLNTLIDVTFTNRAPCPMTELSFMAAVPKYSKLTMHPLSATVIPPGGNATQTMEVVNSSQPHKAIMMRLKIVYKLGAEAKTEETQLKNFPDFL